MRKYLCLFLTITIAVQASAQLQISDVKKSIDFDIDEKGNIYLSDNQSNVYKFDADQKHVFTYSPRYSAYPDVLDASTTTKILIFNRDRQEYTFLDWLMSPIATVSIDNEKFEYVTLLTQSNLNSLWAIDNVKFVLTKLTSDMKKVLVETNLETLLTSEFEPLFMKEHGNLLYISTHNNGILVFDNLGNFKKKVPFNGVRSFGFKDDLLYFTKGTNLLYYSTLNFSVKEESLQKNYLKVILREDVYYSLDSTGRFETKKMDSN